MACQAQEGPREIWTIAEQQVTPSARATERTARAEAAPESTNRDPGLEEPVREALSRCVRHLLTTVRVLVLKTTADKHLPHLSFVLPRRPHTWRVLSVLVRLGLCYFYYLYCEAPIPRRCVPGSDDNGVISLMAPVFGRSCAEAQRSLSLVVGLCSYPAVDACEHPSKCFHGLWNVAYQVKKPWY